MVVITFYLNCCVFPRDTKQYPRRLSRSAWDLTKGGDAIGFSGTNDNHRLLPLGITQREPNEPSLRATNGRMVDLLRVNTREYSVLSGEPFNVNESVKSSGNTLSVWQSLLRLACDEKCNALIDTGALLAGVPTYKAAIFLAKSPRLPESVAGITYYDTRKTYDCWVVLERTKKLVTPLKSSPIHERDTFVIFDEARSRGSDMKLLSDACALLTLGPKMTKDKLMQGAGRLRQLGCDQKLWLTSTKEVERSIRQVTGCELGPIGVMQVLQWVVESTQQQCTLGLLEWGQSGIDYCGKESDSKLESKDDDWSLEYLYGGARSPMKIATIIQDRVKNSSAAGDLLKVLEEVGKHGNRYGREDEVLVTSLSEECEREVQEEKKIQVEELELGGELEPLKEEEWNFEQLFRANAVKDLGSDAGIDSMKVKSNTYFKSLIEVDWNQANLYGTKNFWKTVEQPDSPPELRSSKHLRTIDSLVVFKDLCVLLLTRFETDAILKLLRTHRLQDTGCFRLVQLEFLFGAMRRCHDKALPLSDVPLSIGYPTREALSDVVLPSAVMTACRLFNGDTDFLSKSHPQLTEKTLRLLLDSMQDREKTLREFIEECRSPQRWNRSWLHELTVEMHYDEVASGQKHVILSLPNENEATKAA
ncbi:hypothetical protein Poli38472_013238 [Pythium oligandrum]|uniref:ubiquitinyl hydrolase 1 n=1 Tax=Pythium oligandrum TaxID=41045 RepID=A0A8K1C396_PYTOL|nr:hypothetical protein Poli38472_013238 [Pythium oligandrum]|eukprot:TMW55347.1 hypothetical protein Poli38472_013238 [Pythium oligandrum]